jgi:hypothetical protein
MGPGRAGTGPGRAETRPGGAGLGLGEKGWARRSRDWAKGRSDWARGSRDWAISHCLTGPVDYLFASRHKGPRFKSLGGYSCEPGILLLALSRYKP